MKELLVVDLGLMEYGAAWGLQRRAVAARKAGAVPDLLLLCEHPHVITLGRSGKISNLRAPDQLLRQMGVSFFETNRGGDITYHGPGQLVGYPILNLNEIRRDVAWYVRSLEEAMIRATAEFGIASKRVAGWTGVWVEVSGRADKKEVEEGKEVKDEEKIGAIGVHLSRWVTSHGFAYNVSTDLRYFDLIVPCGIAGKRATSLEKLLGRRVELKEVAPRIAAHLGEIFGLAPRACARDVLDSMLPAHQSELLGTHT
jgi:lipoyl(octanoyl) transferase